MKQVGVRQYHIYRFARRVLAVASHNTATGEWRAYIEAVDGINHDNEWLGVAHRGDLLPKTIAELIFPQLKHLQWRG